MPSQSFGIVTMGPQNDLANFHLARTLEGHSSAVSCVKFEPSRGALLLSASGDQTVRLWKHESAELLFSGKEHEGGLNDACWMGGRGTQFATASDDKSLVVWDTESQTLLHRLTGHTNYVFSVSGSFDETMRLWDVRAGTAVREIPAHGDPITSVDWSPDGMLIASGSYDGLCRVWSAQDGRATKTFVHKDNAPVSNVQFTPNGRFLLITTLNGRITLRKLFGRDDSAGDVMLEYVGHANEQLCLVPTLTIASQEGGRPWLFCGSEDHALYVWRIRKSRKPSEVSNGADSGEKYCQRIGGRKSAEEEGEGHCGPVLCVHSHPKTVMVASGSKDSTIKLWTNPVSNPDTFN